MWKIIPFWVVFYLFPPRQRLSCQVKLGHFLLLGAIITLEYLISWEDIGFLQFKAFITLSINQYFINLREYKNWQMIQHRINFNMIFQRFVGFLPNLHSFMNGTWIFSNQFQKVDPFCDFLEIFALKFVVHDSLGNESCDLRYWIKEKRAATLILIKYNDSLFLTARLCARGLRKSFIVVNWHVALVTADLFVCEIWNWS